MKAINTQFVCVCVCVFVCNASGYFMCSKNYCDILHFFPPYFIPSPPKHLNTLCKSGGRENVHLEIKKSELDIKWIISECHLRKCTKNSKSRLQIYRISLFF